MAGAQTDWINLSNDTGRVPARNPVDASYAVRERHGQVIRFSPLHRQMLANELFGGTVYADTMSKLP